MTRRVPWKALLVATVAAGYLAFAAVLAWRRIPIDYPVYFMAAAGFSRGGNVYAWSGPDYDAVAAEYGLTRYTAPYLYSPLTALVVWPALGWPFEVGLAVWLVVNAAAGLLTGHRLASLAAAPRERWLIRVAIWGFVPYATSLYAGQVNPIGTWLAAEAFLALRQRREALGGLALAVSLLFKPLALALAAWLAWRQRWRALAWLAAALLVILASMAFLVGLSPANFFTLEPGWMGDTYPPRQNLPALAARWLTPHVFGPSLGLSPAAGLWAGVALSAAVAAITVGLCWPPGRRQGGADRQAALIVAAVMLVFARTWYHHFTMLALPLAVLLAGARGQPRWWWAVIIGAWAGINLFGLAWHALVGLTPLLDLATLGALALWGVLGRELWAARRTAPQPAPAAARAT
jgi:hypothetical protein